MLIAVLPIICDTYSVILPDDWKGDLKLWMAPGIPEFCNIFN